MKVNLLSADSRIFFTLYRLADESGAAFAHRVAAETKLMEYRASQLVAGRVGFF